MKNQKKGGTQNSIVLYYIMKSENCLNQYCRMINKNNLVKLSKEQLADILLGLIMKSRSLIKNPLVQLTEATPIVEDYLKQILEKNTVLKYYQLLKINFSKMVHDKARNLVREEEEEGVFHSDVFPIINENQIKDSIILANGISNCLLKWLPKKR